MQEYLHLEWSNDLLIHDRGERLVDMFPRSAWSSATNFFFVPQMLPVNTEKMQSLLRICKIPWTSWSVIITV